MRRLRQAHEGFREASYLRKEAMSVLLAEKRRWLRGMELSRALAVHACFFERAYLRGIFRPVTPVNRKARHREATDERECAAKETANPAEERSAPVAGGDPAASVPELRDEDLARLFREPYPAGDAIETARRRAANRGPVRLPRQRMESWISSAPRGLSGLGRFLGEGARLSLDSGSGL